MNLEEIGAGLLFHLQDVRFMLLEAQPAGQQSPQTFKAKDLIKHFLEQAPYLR
jgi:hypothetical protein